MDEVRCKLELRQDETRQSPGRLTGVLMDYATGAGDRPERFLPGSLSWPEGGVVLNLSHDRRQPVMRFEPEEREGRLVVDAPLPDTGRGRDAATMVRDGTLRGLSVEFRAARQRFRDGVREIEAALLTAAAIVDDPSYPAARVEVRGRRAGRRRLWL